MISTVKIKTAEALFPLLSLFHEVDGTSLKSVTLVRTEGEVTEISLQFASKSLVIRCNADDDTVDLSIQPQGPEGETAGHNAPWSDVIGKPIGWSWGTVNQEGYLDGV